MEIQPEQVQCVFGYPQTSSCEDANIIVIEISNDAFNPCSLFFILNLALCYSWLCINLIDVVCHHSCNKINLPVYPCNHILMEHR
jgi:hypothetical protein